MAGQQQSIYAEILLSCLEEEYYEEEIALEYHAFARVVSGEMTVIQHGKTTLFGPGDTLLFPRKQFSTLIKRPIDGLPYKAVVISLTTQRLREFYTNNHFHFIRQPINEIRSYDKNPLLESFFASLIPYFGLKTDLPEKLVSVKIEEAITILRTIDGTIDNLLTNFSQSEKIDLTDFMRKNYMFNMTMEKFGYLTGRSLTTFKRDFKKTFNATPQKWISHKRLELAHHQLSDGKKPIDVYLETGFENLSHFSFAFKKHFGYAPTDIPTINSATTA